MNDIGIGLAETRRRSGPDKVRRPAEPLDRELDLIAGQPKECGCDGQSRFPAERARITVFLLDDHELVRRGLIDLLDSTPDITVVGEAGRAADALHRIPALLRNRTRGVLSTPELRSRRPPTQGSGLTTIVTKVPPQSGPTT